MSIDRNFPFGKIPNGVEVLKIIVMQGDIEIFNSFKYPMEDFIFPIKPHYLSVGQEITIFKQTAVIQSIKIQIETQGINRELIQTLLIEINISSI